MTFYSTIANDYDHIFPFNPTQKQFIEGALSAPHSEKSILDIGCGTGNLTTELSRTFHSVIGIDLNSDMIRIANQKSSHATFFCQDMLGLIEKFRSKQFDAILCLGNTLVHLTDPTAISTFLSQAKMLIKPNGKLLLQIINYDRILEQALKYLPTIENDKIKFERFYQLKDPRQMDFETRLTIKDSGKIIKNTVTLYPLLRKELEHLLKQNGFDTIHWYGSFQKAPLKDDSIPLILEAF